MTLNVFLPFWLMLFTCLTWIYLWHLTIMNTVIGEIMQYFTLPHSFRAELSGSECQVVLSGSEWF